MRRVPGVLTALCVIACVGQAPEEGPDGGAADAGGGDGGGGGGDAAVVDAGDADDALLDVDTDGHDFGDTIVGATSVSVALRIHNIGASRSGPLATVLSGAQAAQFKLVANACVGAELDPGEMCMVVAQFAPGAAGEAQAALVVDSSPGGTVSVALSGRGLAPGTLTIDDASHDFGVVVLPGQSGERGFTVTNTGEAAIGPLTAALGGADATEFRLIGDGCTGQTLAPSQSCAVTARFAPSSAGAKQATLSVSAVTGGAAVATLAGEAQTPATLVVAPSSHDFAPVTAGAQSPPLSLTVTNLGQQQSGTLAVSTGGAQPGQFTVSGGSCAGQTLAGGASCTVTVRFAPTIAAASSATISVGGAPGGTVVASVSGVGLTPASLLAMPGGRDFGAVTVGASSAGFAFSVQNSGQSPTGVLSTALTGAGAGDYGVVDGCGGVVLDGGGSCQIVVSFSPSLAGSRPATLTVSGAPGGSAPIALAGTGLTPAALSILPANRAFGDVTVGGQSGTQIFTVRNDGQSSSGPLAVALGGANPGQFQIVSNPCAGLSLGGGGSCQLVARFAPTTTGFKSATLTASASPGGAAPATLTGNALAPAQLEITPATHSFGNVLVGQQSAAQLFTVRNAGQTATGAVSTAVDPTNFLVTANGCGATLGPGASCTLSVAFRPGSAGTKTANLTASASPGGSDASVLSGVGLSPAQLLITPASHPYGAVVIGQSADKSFTVTNLGDQTSGAILVTVSGPGFSELSSTCGGAALGAGASCTVTVRFAPGVSGLVIGSLQASASPGGTDSASLSGNGLTPAALSISPSPTFDYGGVRLGDVASQAFVVSNDGQQASSALAVSLGGATSFSVVGDGCSGATLTGGASCVISVEFAPGAGTTDAATLVASAVTGGAASTDLAGTGLPNQAPSIDSLSALPLVVVAGEAVTLSATASDPESDPLTFEWTQPAPASPAGAFADASAADTTWTAPAVASSTDFTLRLTVRDDRGGEVSQVVVVTVITPAALAIFAGAPGTSDCDLGAAVAGTSSLVTCSYTIENTGEQSTGPLTVTLGGAEAASFTLDDSGCAGVSLAGGASCTVDVTGTPPLGAPAGDVSATVDASATPGGVAQGSVSMTVLGAGGG